MKFLIIRFSSIGDIVLASPVFRCLKTQAQTAEVHLLTKQSFKAVTEANPYIDRFFYFDKDLDAVINQLKLEDYDYIIDLHNNIRSNRVKRALKKQSFTINKLSVEKFLLTRFGINRMPARHITQRSLDTVAAFGVKDDGLGLDYFIPQGAFIKDNDIPTAHQAGYIALVIGASYFTKRLPQEKLQQLCTLIDHPIILLGGKEEKEIGDAIAATDPVKIYNACGKFSLNESADLVRRSKLVISHDTGLQYIACAFKKPVLAIWGATSPKLAVAPYYGSKEQATNWYENMIVPNLSCQPCSNYGTKKCPKGHFKCMQQQDIPLIAEKALKRLRG
jgi:heptosyltransferase-2